MKKFIITIIIAVGFFTSLNAQTTGPEYNQLPEATWNFIVPCFVRG